MTDLSSLTADQLAEKVNRILLHDEVTDAEWDSAFPAFTELVARARRLKTAEDALEACPFCHHAWSRHVPEDGMCDAGGCRNCGRDLPWMQQRIAELSRAALAAIRPNPDA